jgi:hypothetical protein
LHSSDDSSAAAGPAFNALAEARQWQRPSDSFLRQLLALPQLALVAESCPAEIALHQALLTSPTEPVSAAQLASIADADARANYAMWLEFRGGLLQAGSLEAYYLALMRSQRISVPPLFIDHLVQAIVQHLQQGQQDAFQARAAELLFRQQRLTLTEGRLLCADRAYVDALPGRTGALDVLTPENAFDYWQGSERQSFALDLTHQISNDLGHGFSFKLTRSHSGLSALARVLEQWLQHFLGSPCTITPLQKVDDPAWRWHIGLDVEAMQLLNDLYQDRPVNAERMAGLISLFRLDFPTAAPGASAIYLGLAMTAERTLKLKPQNLLLNLPPDLLAVVMNPVQAMLPRVD